MNKNFLAGNLKRSAYFSGHRLHNGRYLMPENNISGAANAAAQSDRPNDALWNLLKRKSALIIDDDEGFRFTFSIRLGEIFKDVDDTFSGFAAIDLIKRGGNYDVIFLDMFMKNHTALDIYDDLKKQADNSLIHIITAEINTSQYEEAISRGIPICPKPVDDEIFLNIAKMLSEF